MDAVWAIVFVTGNVAPEPHGYPSVSRRVGGFIGTGVVASMI